MIIALDDNGNIIYLNLAAKECLEDIDFKRNKINYANLVSDLNEKENVRTKINEKIKYSIENVIFSVIQLLDNVDTSNTDELINIYKKYKRPMKLNCLRMSRTINNIIDI